MPNNCKKKPKNSKKMLISKIKCGLTNIPLILLKNNGKKTLKKLKKNKKKVNNKFTLHLILNFMTNI